MPVKTIAVPVKSSASRKARPAAVKPAEPVSAETPVLLSPALARPPRAVQKQPSHRYRVGERLRMLNGGYSIARAAAYCKVVSLLPYEGRGALLYRVHSETEAFERIVAEADLSRNSETA